MKDNIDNFAHKSKSWDMNSRRVKNAQSIAELIVKNIILNKDMELMDFGAGTGLLSFFIAPFVKKIVAIDNSPSMLKEFELKCKEFVCETEVIQVDISIETIDRKFDGIISSMTIHHLKDTLELFYKFYNMLDSGGFIAIADLDSEDGSFHNDPRGVFHSGFDRETLEAIAQKVGFSNIMFETAGIIKKAEANFSVFLMTARKV